MGRTRPVAWPCAGARAPSPACRKRRSGRRRCRLVPSEPFQVKAGPDRCQAPLGYQNRYSCATCLQRCFGTKTVCVADRCVGNKECHKANAGHEIECRSAFDAPWALFWIRRSPRLQSCPSGAGRREGVPLSACAAARLRSDGASGRAAQSKKEAWSAGSAAMAPSPRRLLVAEGGRSEHKQCLRTAFPLRRSLYTLPWC